MKVMFWLWASGTLVLLGQAVWRKVVRPEPEPSVIELPAVLASTQ